MTGPKNLAASIRERLRQRAAAEHRPFEEVLTYYAIEWFLKLFEKRINDVISKTRDIAAGQVKP